MRVGTVIGQIVPDAGVAAPQPRARQPGVAGDRALG